MKKISNYELKKINGGESSEFWSAVGKGAGAATYCATKLGWTNFIPGAHAMCTATRVSK
ncbi:hypothetical protein [Macrococcoides caseolyticum]|uniref:hypothetical protein n=1 Tax=Macrococcoides caseolyticum TaxID=69966 RepID=UPI001475A652|nr:hypothetical protein [Macrococcus caseolyticus]